MELTARLEEETLAGERWVAELVSRWPRPPRPVPLRPVAALAPRGVLVGLLLLAGGGIGFAGWIVLLPGEGLTRLALVGLGLALAVGSLAYGVRYLLCLRDAIAGGIVTTAAVVSVRRGVVLDGSVVVRGARRVEHPLGSFDDVFELFHPWAQALAPGTKMNVLAHPSRRQVLFELGPRGAD